MPPRALAVTADPPIAIRPAAERDISGLVTLVNALAAEGGNLFIMPIEGAAGIKALSNHLAQIASSGHERVLLAAMDGEIAGLFTATRNPHPAKRGVAAIGIGVAPWARRRGIARALMNAIEVWARGEALDRLELTVVASNRAALALYRSLGYDTEGVLRASARIDGALVDQLMMAKLL
jgi:RimJ/RimL family protein N-acetyltransferase